MAPGLDLIEKDYHVPKCYRNKHCKTTKAEKIVAPAWLPSFTPAPGNSSWPVGTADCVAMDVLFDDGEGTIVPEATAVRLAAVVVAGPRLELVVEIEVEASTWLAVPVAAMMMSGGDSADETAEEVAAGAGPEEAPAEGLNTAVRPQSSASAPT